MVFIAAISIVVPLFLLMGFALVPRKAANAHPVRLGKLVTLLTVVLAFGGMTSLVAGGFTIRSVLGILPLATEPSLYLDGISGIMLVLVAGVGSFITRFSVRYLHGESEQGNYFRWVAATIGSVSLSIVSGHLGWTILGLTSAGLCLHQLLTHYSDRPAATRAACLKFAFSRLGDLFLIVSAGLLFKEFGTLDLPTLFEQAGQLTSRGDADLSRLHAVAWLLGLAALLKSAQFPFHTWLPETLEAPTPVSALMHAGIVNAGGYLLIRLAPLFAISAAAMQTIALAGAFTAIIAALVMMTQSSVKKTLAWSTIAQMGFMIFQCGLGAFSAALLHIVAHSLYKAHAFLGSGSVLSEQSALSTSPPPVRTSGQEFVSCLTALVLSVGTFALTSWAFSISLSSKPGGLVLGTVLLLGVTRWLWEQMKFGRSYVIPGLAISTILFSSYFSLFHMASALAAPTIGAVIIDGFGASQVILLSALFVAVFFLEFAVRSNSVRWPSTLYVHASNGFYVSTFWRHVSRTITS